MSGANARSRKPYGGFPRLLENSRHSESDPDAVISCVNFDLRLLGLQRAIWFVTSEAPICRSLQRFQQGSICFPRA
jgi:hypothetical protein